MRASVSMARDDFARLRNRIAEIEGRRGAAVGSACAEDGQGTALPSLPGSGRSRLAGNVPILSPRRAADTLSFAIPRLDRMLAGGFRRDALHEVRSATTRDVASATGFAAALLARLSTSDDRPLLWVTETDAAREGGQPYGIGIGRFGLDPRRLVVVRVKKPADALWVFEEGLACRGLAGVLAEIRGNPHLLDLTASRRLALRAAAGGGTGLLLRQAGEGEPSAALTRWLVEPIPAAVTGNYAAGIGYPAWRLTLERNRIGQTGTIDVEWHHDRRAFAPAVAVGAAAEPAHPRPLVPVPPDRPAPSPDARKIVAFVVPHDLPREIKRRRL